jgi:hypothetical protein
MTARKNLDKVREEILSAAGKDVKEDRLHVLELDVLGKATQELRRTL